MEYTQNTVAKTFKVYAGVNFVACLLLYSGWLAELKRRIGYPLGSDFNRYKCRNLCDR